MNFDYLIESLKLSASSLCLFFTKDGILVHVPSAQYQLPLAATQQLLTLTIEDTYLDHNTAVILCEVEQLPSGYEIYPIRKLLLEIANQDFEPILQAYHWVNWAIKTRFCSRCGHALQHSMTQKMKFCVSCNTEFFPKFSPAVIVVVEREDHILLARSPHFIKDVYSLIAGFVEGGETAEQAAHREVMEEVGIRIHQLSYVASQSWPFPDSFMLGFRAQYLSGELTPDPKEIEDAQWFPKHQLPLLPPSISIARRLIESCL